MKLLESKNVPINVHDGARRNFLTSQGHDGILNGFVLSCSQDGVVTGTRGTLMIHGFRIEIYDKEEQVTDKPRSYQTNYTGWNWLVLNISYERESFDSTYSFSCYPDYFVKDTDIENGETGRVCRAIAKFKKSGGTITEFVPLRERVEDEMKVKDSEIDDWFK